MTKEQVEIILAEALRKQMDTFLAQQQSIMERQQTSFAQSTPLTTRTYGGSANSSKVFNLRKHMKEIKEYKGDRANQLTLPEYLQRFLQHLGE